MPYRGRSILGSELRIGVPCGSGTGARTPGAPTAAPTYRVYTEAGTLVTNGTLPPTERYTTTGLFEYMLHLGTLFATGRYYVRYAWTISATSYVAIDAFEVTAPGSTSGMYNSMFFLDQPQADWILATTDSGNTAINRGPRV